jgi:hypothetical protein
MVTRIAWLLNLDAERELDDPRRYRVSTEMSARIEQLRARMTLLLDPGDRIIERDDTLEGCVALPFSATPGALARIRQAGLTPPPAPSLAQLTRVNSRAFCAELGQTLPGARYVRSLEALHDTLRGTPASESWLLKRDFGFAGRERRRVFAGELDASTEGFARRSFARGQGLQVEPWVARSQDFTRHGYVFVTGAHVLGVPMGQECDAHGSWLGSRALRDDELRPDEAAQLEHEAIKVAEALAAAGYFGPFGVDAYRYVDRHEQPCFQPRSELNARFSMGYPRGLLERALRVPDFQPD